MKHNPKLDERLANVAMLAEFEKLSPSLVAFAEAHSLFVRKYLCDQPMWSFYFQHPLGGIGMLQLSLGVGSSGAYQASTAGAWYVDDQDSHLRSTYWVPVNQLATLGSGEIANGLTKVLDQLLGAAATSRTRLSRISERNRDDFGDVLLSEFEKSLRLPK